jgi:Protein of unknown function (DUF3489)
MKSRSPGRAYSNKFHTHVPSGATRHSTVGELCWLPYAFAGALKKKLGLTVTSENVEGGERLYRLPPT